MSGKSAIVTHRRRCWIVFRGDEFHFLKFETQIVQRFLDQVGVFVSDMAELCGGNAHEKHRAAGMAVLGGLQPGVVRMPVDLFFQRVQNAQPRIGGEARAWNGHNKFSWGCGQSSARYQIISTTMLSFSSSGTAMLCRRFALGSENFCKLDQSGILAQNFSVCGNLVRGLFSLVRFRTLTKPPVKCSTYNCRAGGAEIMRWGRRAPSPAA